MKFYYGKYFPYFQSLYFLLIGAISSIWLFSIPGDSKNALFLGLSLSRILLLLLPALLSALVILFLFLNHKNLTWQKKFQLFFSAFKVRVFLLILFLISALFFYLIMLPEYRLGSLQAYWVRLQPVFFYVFAAGFEVFILLFLSVIKVNLVSFKNIGKEKSGLIFLGLITLLTALIIGFVITTRIGLIPDNFAWSVAGAPLTIEQLYWVFVFFILAAGGLHLFRIKIYFKKLDLWVFLLLWLAANLVWQFQPINWSAYLIEPTSPNYEYYPNSDAAVHVSGARYALLGEGINGGSMTDKPFYMALLAGLQLISNGNYLNLAALQTLILALGAGLIYLLGKELYNRDLGLLLAVFYIIYEGNASRVTGHITAMYSKLFMSEPLMGLFILLVVYLAVKWIRKRNPATFYWMCGVCAFATLIRPHGLFVFAGVFAYSVLPYLKNLRPWFKKYFWGVFVYLSALLPWLITARLKHGYLPVFYKIERVLFNRFEGQSFTQPIALASLDPGILLSYPAGTESILEKVGWVSSNFINNIFKSLLIFPLSLRFDDLLTTIDKPYWWIASIQSWQPAVNILFFIHLGIILIGVFAFWRKSRQAALLPLVVLLAYFLSNAFARSSGGRHLYPVIWVIYTYYTAGILFLIRRLFGIFREKTIQLLPSEQEIDFKSKGTSFTVLKICFVFLFLGSYLTWIDLGFPLNPQNNVINGQEMKDYTQSSQIPETVQALFADGKIRALEGEIWYPVQTNELVFYTSAFELIREIPIKLVLDTSEKSLPVPDRSNAVIFQCGTQRSDTIRILGIVLLDTQPYQSYWDEEQISICH